MYIGFLKLKNFPAWCLNPMAVNPKKLIATITIRARATVKFKSAPGALRKGIIVLCVSP